MKKLLIVALLLAFPVFGEEQVWENVPLLDGMCLSKVKENPDKHTTKCLLQCSKDGVGILTTDGYFKLDEEGAKKALTLIKESGKKDSVRVNVKGTKEGDIVKVTSVTLS